MSTADPTALTLVTPLSWTWSRGAARGACCKLQAVPNQRSRSGPQGAEPSQGHKPTFQQEKPVSKYPGRGTFLGASVPVWPAVRGNGGYGGGPQAVGFQPRRPARRAAGSPSWLEDRRDGMGQGHRCGGCSGV